MEQIQFSFRYLKFRHLDNKSEVTLVGVFPVNLEDLPEDFLHYDTTYTARNGRFKEYALPKQGKYLLLLFLSGQVYDFPFVFTTLRKWTPEKEGYYKSKIGEKFEINGLVE